jgi:hypothetical protein
MEQQQDDWRRAGAETWTFTDEQIEESSAYCELIAMLAGPPVTFKERFIAPCRWPVVLREQVDDGYIVAAGYRTLVGYDVVTVARATLFEALRAAQAICAEEFAVDELTLHRRQRDEDEH